MDLSTFEQLLSPKGQSALVAAIERRPRESDFLAVYEKLRKAYPPELAKAAVETAILREKAKDKFPHAAAMYFTREALEQATSATVAAHRAKRFRDFDTVADLCCGIGGDAIALATAGRTVFAIDNDPVRTAMTSANFVACELGERTRTVTADVLTDVLPAVDALFCDPARRSEGRRFLSLDDYRPAPAGVLARFPAGFPAAFKVAPGVPLEELTEFEAEAEFISLHGELKECVLWFGPFRTTARRATALPSGKTLTADGAETIADISPPLRYVYDPDPSVTRSGLVSNLAAKLNGLQLDYRIAFLTSDERVETPFATAYEVEEVLPFHEKRLKEWLRERNVGRVTPVKRGSAIDTDALLRGFKLRGDEHRTILFTQIADRSVAIVAHRVEAGPRS